MASVTDILKHKLSLYMMELYRQHHVHLNKKLVTVFHYTLLQEKFLVKNDDDSSTVLFPWTYNQDGQLYVSYEKQNIKFTCIITCLDPFKIEFIKGSYRFPFWLTNQKEYFDDNNQVSHVPGLMRTFQKPVEEFFTYVLNNIRTIDPHPTTTHISTN